MTPGDQTQPSRDLILANIRRQSVPRKELPVLQGNWTTYQNRWAQFAEVLAFVGGQSLALAEASTLEAELRKLPPIANARSVVCRVPDLNLGNFDLELATDPRALAGIDVAIMPGLFAVAENGAVWVNDHGLAHRAIYFIAQHLVLVVHRSQIVDHLHQAYERLAFLDRGYGLFISGPSKTADIEQSLVIGAHGPRSLTVVISGSEGG